MFLNACSSMLCCKSCYVILTRRWCPSHICTSRCWYCNQIRILRPYKWHDALMLPPLVVGRLALPSRQLLYHTHQQWINNQMKRRFKCSLSNQTETKLKQEYKYKITYPNNQISKYINRLTKGSQRLLKTSELFAGSNISNFFCRAYLPQILMDVTHIRSVHTSYTLVLIIIAYPST